MITQLILPGKPPWRQELTLSKGRLLLDDQPLNGVAFRRLRDSRGARIETSDIAATCSALGLPITEPGIDAISMTSYMGVIGRRGGSKSSPKKTAAVRENARKPRRKRA